MLDSLCEESRRCPSAISLPTTRSGLTLLDVTPDRGNRASNVQLIDSKYERLFFDAQKELFH